MMHRDCAMYGPRSVGDPAEMKRKTYPAVITSGGQSVDAGMIMGRLTQGANDEGGIEPRS